MPRLRLALVCAAALVVGTAGFLWLRATRSHDSFMGGERLRPPAVGFAYGLWVSDHEALTAEVPPTSGKACVARADMRTGALTPLPEASRALADLRRRHPTCPAVFSPDGKWLIASPFQVRTRPNRRSGREDRTLLPVNLVTAIRLSDGHAVVLHGAAGRPNAAWLADSRRWVVLEPSADRRGVVATLYRVDGPKPGRERVVPVHIRNLRGYGPGWIIGATPDDELITFNGAPLGPLAVNLRTTPARVAVLVPRGLAVTAGPGAPVALSPDGRELVWARRTWASPAPAWRLWLTRFGLSAPVRSARLELWGLTRGSTRARLIAAGDVEPSVQCAAVQWLPDGKHVCLVLSDGAWLVPVKHPH